MENIDLANEQVQYQQDGNVYIENYGISFYNQGASPVTLNNELVIQPNGGAITFDCKKGEMFKLRYSFRFGQPLQNLITAGLPPRSLVVVYLKKSTENKNK